MATELPQFNILDHAERLEKVGETAREIEFKCPVCGAENLKVSKKDGAYKNWSCDCSIASIREAIRPWAEVADKAQKPVRPKSTKSFYYNDRDGKPLVKVERVDRGNGKKDFYQSHWDGSKWKKGVPQAIRKNITLYRYADVQQAIAQGKLIYVVEGEGTADDVWRRGGAATTSLAGCGSYRSYGDYSKDLVGAKLVLCPDRDTAGIKYMDAVAEDYPNSQWFYAYPNSPVWDNLPSKGGLDLSDWIADGATIEQIEAAIEPTRRGKTAIEPPAAGETIQVNVLVDVQVEDSEKIEFGNFCQRALSSLYVLHDPDRPWVCISGQFYQWQGAHYEPSPDEVEYRRVFEYADNFQRINKKSGLPEYPFASPHHVEQAIKWIKMGLAVDPRRVNPAGLNCTNGILKIVWQGDRPSVELAPHSPKHVFIYKPVVTYDPNANSEACDRMLAALEPGQRDVFLKVAAASLDLPTVRKYRGRLVRALLMKGDGSNGKDTLRESLSAIYGYQG